MEFKELKLKGVFEITLIPHFDARGFFSRTFDENIFSKDNSPNYIPLDTVDFLILFYLIFLMSLKTWMIQVFSKKSI